MEESRLYEACYLFISAAFAILFRSMFYMLLQSVGTPLCY
jgi:hypothetical protein